MTTLDLQMPIMDGFSVMEALNATLEHAVHERTAELRESEARYQSLTELACDWFGEQDDGWDMAERKQLQANIDERRPFLDFLLHRSTSDGKRLQYRVSGQPMFDHGSRFIGYRGVGVEVTTGR